MAAANRRIKIPSDFCHGFRHPVGEFVGVVCDQRGVVAVFNGFDDCGIIYSSTSGPSVLPMLAYGRKDEWMVPVGLDYSPFMDVIGYRAYEANIACVVPADMSWLKVGSCVQYDMVRAQNGVWVAYNIRCDYWATSRKILDNNYTKRVLYMRIDAIVVRVGPSSVLWNDDIGRVCVTVDADADLVLGERVSCSVWFNATNFRTHDPGSEFWYGFNVVKSVCAHGQSVINGRLSTSENWVIVARDLQSNVVQLRRKGREQEMCGTVYADDIALRYHADRAPVGQLCKVTYAKCIGSGWVFLFAVLVTPCDDHCVPSPLSYHPNL